MMRKFYLVVTLTTCLLAPLTVQAQPGGGPGGPGGPGRMGGMRGMRNNPKMRLSGFIRGIDHLERNKTNAVSPTQARSIVRIINPWTKKAHMSESDAKTLLSRLNGVLTARQKSELERDRPGRPGGDWGGRRAGRRGDGEHGERPRGDRPRGNWGGRPGGPGGPGGPPSAAQMQKMQNFFKNYNPFYPPTKYSEVKQLPEPMREGFTRRYRVQQETLNALSRKAR